MTEPIVDSATNSTMLITPMIIAPPKTTHAVTGALDPVPLIVVTVSLILPMTPAASRTPKSTAITISQTRNSATDSTQENFSTVHGFMCRSCSRARRGPRAADLAAPLTGPGPGWGAPPSAGGAAGAGATGAAGSATPGAE